MRAIRQFSIREINLKMKSQEGKERLPKKVLCVSRKKVQGSSYSINNSKVLEILILKLLKYMSGYTSIVIVLCLYLLLSSCPFIALIIRTMWMDK